MSASARFTKPFLAPMSTGHDGSDFRMGQAYQMVPVNGSRQLFAEIFGGEVLIAVRDPDVCEFSFESSSTLTSIVLKQSKQLTLHGRSAGRTRLLAMDKQTGQLLAELVVSVKTERLVTYNLHRLRDIRRETPRSIDPLKNMMLTVEMIYLRQANVRLQGVHVQSEPLFIPNDLGDPIDVRLRDPIDDPIGSVTQPRFLVKAKLKELGMTKETLNLVSAWNLVRGDIELLGNTLGIGAPLVFVAAHSSADISATGATEANTYAHEIGHAFGLFHDGHPTAGSLMSPLNPPGFQFFGRDIDTLNGSGTRFRTL